MIECGNSMQADYYKYLKLLMRQMTDLLMTRDIKDD